MLSLKMNPNSSIINANHNMRMKVKSGTSEIVEEENPDELDE